MLKFHRQQPGEGAVKKSIQKLSDHKRDLGTRLKHLKIIIDQPKPVFLSSFDNSIPSDLQSIFEKNYSHIFYIFYENFLIVESNLRLKGYHRAQREELDTILTVFEQILINLPELIHKRWQYQSIDCIIKKLLHTQNSIKVRRDGVNFFLLWLRTLRENALPRTVLLYACLIPGFPPPSCSDGKLYSLEWLVNMPVNEEYGVHQTEIACLVPSSSNEKQPSDVTKCFLNTVLEHMVLKAEAINWKDKEKSSFSSLSYLWDLFKEHYLPNAFDDFNLSTSIYSNEIALPDPRPSVTYRLNVSDSGALEQQVEVSSGCALLTARVSIIKFVVAFTGYFERNDTLKIGPSSRIEALQRQVLKQLLEFTSSQSDKESDVSESTVTTATSAAAANGDATDPEALNSNASTLTEKESSISSLSSLDDKLQSSTTSEENLMRKVFYSTRENVDIVHELFRQAFMLPLTEVATMKRVVKVYQQWLKDGDIPIFMKSAPFDDSFNSEVDGGKESALRNTSYIRGQLKPVMDDLNFVNVCAGPESTYQLFIANSAYVFMVEPPPNAPKLIDSQIEACHKVLKLYRYVVLNVDLADVTWNELLRVLLHVTRVMFHRHPNEDDDVRKHHSVAGRLACPVFQTLIVSWIKANLFVPVPSDLWDELVDVLSAACHWEELVSEWSKIMRTMTRVLSRNVYQLNVKDLPLDRLTEQKHKKQGGQRNRPVSGPTMSERSFSRGWSQDSFAQGEPTPWNTRSPRQSTFASQSIDAESLHEADEKVRLKKHSIDSLRFRSNTVPNAKSRNDSPNQESEENLSVQSVVLNSPTDSNSSSTLKRHMSASDVSVINNNVIVSARHRTGSEGPGADTTSSVEVDASPSAQPLTTTTVHRVAWQDPTHQVHNYQSGSGDASESTSLSVQSIEEYDEFDALVTERLQSDGRDKRSDEMWPYEGASVDSGSIDVDWNRIVEASADGKPPFTSSVTNTPNISVTHHDGIDAQSPDVNPDRTFDSTGSALASPPYQLYENETPRRNSSSTRLIEAESFNASEDESDQIAPKMDGESRKSARVAETESAVTRTMERFAKPTSLFVSSNVDTARALLTPDSLKSDKLPMIEELQNDDSDRSILSGGKQTGWMSDNAAAIWRRLLGVLGDVNEIDDPDIHEAVFHSLIDIWKTLFKIRQNIGIVTDNTLSPDNQELVPPLRIFAPWAFKAAFDVSDSHKAGKLLAFQLLCNVTIQREHDIPLEEEHFAQFYALLHLNLHSPDQDIVNKIIESCAQYFPCCLPASTLLLLDFIYACLTIAASSDLKAPRVQAQTLLGSTLCFPNIYHDIPVLSPNSEEPSADRCKNIEDYIVEALLTSSKKEQSAVARYVALSSTGVWLYEELTSCQQMHSRVKEAINVLLVSIKGSNRVVASVACSQLHLLTHCSNELLNSMPDMPPRIIEVMSLTTSSLFNTEAKNSETGRQLLVSLLLCILDWCMAVPVELLTDTYGVQSEKRLIRTVFKALQTAALGKPGHSAKHSYSLSDLKSNDFDPNLKLEIVQGETGASVLNRSKSSISRSNVAPIDSQNVVSLAAHTALSHLINYLGHFPLARGTSVLTSLVSENHDHPDASEDLSPTLFNSSEVQFLIYNHTCLLSVIELPAESHTPGGGPTAGLSTSDRCVRFIVRDAGGKYSWDASVLHGPPNITESSTPVSCKPLTALDEEISQAAKRYCQAYAEYAEAEKQLKRQIRKTDLPQCDLPLDENCSDKLEQLLQYIGHSSPECQTQIGLPLNIPFPPPSCLSDELERKATRCVLGHHQSLGGSYEENAKASNWKGAALHPRPTSTSHMPFGHARLLCAELGFVSRDSRHQINLLTKNERLLRELKNLDDRKCRETHKVAVFYIARGQEDKVSILSNTCGSKEFEQFVAGLGWEVDLSTHCGFRGKLQRDGSNGATAPYYATSTLEVIYHVATRFPSPDESVRNVKIRHLGNDEVHIVWSEHHRDYRRGIIPTEFGDVLIVIYPIRHGLFRIQIMKKPEIPYFGPLFDGAVVNARVLPVLVRETAINAGRAKRSLISLYQPFYEERTKYLHQIIERFKDERTFEDYCSNLFCPVQADKRTEWRISQSSTQTDPALMSHKNSTASFQSGLNVNNNNTIAPSLYPRVSHKKSRPPPPGVPGKSETAMSTSSDYLESASRPRLALSSSSNVPPPSGVQGRAAPAPYFSTVLDPPSEQLKTHGRLFSFNKKTSSVTFQVRPHSRSTSSFQPAPLCSSEDLLDLSDFPSPPQSPPIETSQVHNI